MMIVDARRRRWLTWVVLAGAGVAAASGAGHALTTRPSTGPTTAPAPAAATAAAPAGTTRVHRDSIVLAFDADGVLEPVDPFEVRFSTRRYQGELLVCRAATAGAIVAKGDVLLAVDTDPIDRQIAAAESALEVARAAVAKAEADASLGDRTDATAIDGAKQSAADAQESLARWDQTDGPAAALAGGLEARQADANLDDAVDELDQLHQMYKSEDLTNQTADIVLKRASRSVDLYKGFDRVAKAAADRATAYVPAVHRHGLATAAAEAAEAVEELQAAQAQARVVRSSTLTTTRATAAGAERMLAELRKDRAGLTVTSPIDGVVVYGAFEHKAWKPTDPKRLAVGEKVEADQVLMTVYTPGKLRAVAACPEAYVTRMPPGTRVTVTPDALLEATYDGTSGPAGVVVSGEGASATVAVPVTLPPVDDRLVPGYAVRVGVDVPTVTGVLVVPYRAVYHGKVWVRTPDGRDEVRPVTVGRTDYHNTEVRSGLSEGDAVLTTAKVPGA